MQKAEKMALIEVSLMRAADKIGDLTEPVMSHFYQRYPQARESFERLACGNHARLEAVMVENVLYCIMQWFERPEEIRIILYGSVPHHQETLKVGADWYHGLRACSLRRVPRPTQSARAIGSASCLTNGRLPR